MKNQVINMYKKKYFEILSLKTYKNCKSIILYFVAFLKIFIGNFKCCLHIFNKKKMVFLKKISDEKNFNKFLHYFNIY